MTLSIDVNVARVRAPMSRARAIRIARGVLAAERVRNALVSITFVSADRMRALNRRHLGHHRPTDVIAFGFERPTPRDPVIGDVYIAPAVATQHARARRISRREELARLIVHGTLHVIGYDHPADERERSSMWRRQERLVRRLASGGPA